MLLPVLTITVLFIGADTRPETMVALSKRSGAARGPAMDFAKTFSSKLKTLGVPVGPDIEEVGSCNSKVPCLVDVARKKGFAAIVTIDIGQVLEEVVVHAEALSVDEDGRKVASYDAEGPEPKVVENLSELGATFAPAIRAVLGVSVPVSRGEAAPEVTAPPPKNDSPWSTAKKTGVALLGVGAASLISAGALGLITLSVVGQRNTLCPGTAACVDQHAWELDASARTTQTIGIVLAITGALVAATGAVLTFVDFGGGESVTLVPSLNGNVFSFTLAGTL